MVELPTTAIPNLLSIIIPTFNEEESVTRLASEIREVVGDIGCDYELIFIDDGSTDTTASVLDEMARDDSHVRIIQFRRNFGKAAALDAGFQVARGDVIFTME